MPPSRFRLGQLVRCIDTSGTAVYRLLQRGMIYRVERITSDEWEDVAVTGIKMFWRNSRFEPVYADA